jgi:hypothetical protein
MIIALCVAVREWISKFQSLISRTLMIASAISNAISLMILVEMIIGEGVTYAALEDDIHTKHVLHTTSDYINTGISGFIANFIHPLI